MSCSIGIAGVPRNGEERAPKNGLLQRKRALFTRSTTLLVQYTSAPQSEREYIRTSKPKREGLAERVQLKREVLTTGWRGSERIDTPTHESYSTTTSSVLG